MRNPSPYLPKLRRSDAQTSCDTENSKTPSKAIGTHPARQELAGLQQKCRTAWSAVAVPTEKCTAACSTPAGHGTQKHSRVTHHRMHFPESSSFGTSRAPTRQVLPNPNLYLTATNTTAQIDPPPPTAPAMIKTQASGGRGGPPSPSVLLHTPPFPATMLIRSYYHSEVLQNHLDSQYNTWFHWLVRHPRW